MSRFAVALGLAAVLSASYAYAQFDFGFRGDSNMPARFPTEAREDKAFGICRLMYTSVRREPSGGGWRTDYPYGEINLMIRSSELTKIPVKFKGERQPEHYVVRLTDDQLFECPFTIASDVGTIGLTQIEAERLGLYLEKGGFLWVDDFWGTAAWTQWQREIGKALPPAEYPISDIPMDDPILQSQFIITKVPQITNIGFWRRSGGGQETSERGADSARVNFRAIRDKSGRIMVVMTHNTDVADSWEREGEDPGFFYQFSPDGYALGVNVLLHALTH